ncbi:uncharacterized protein LOC133321631, partial [Musca vetustissima]|uniref:uncharacterized protein LOC133321631 n=1 Tax=Musca vetustissima TaxID=27455 RepID=UPI002AB7EA93
MVTAPPTTPSASNGFTSAIPEDNLEDLKIIGHLKNIEKLNEKRRVFLSNTITSEYSSDEKTESTTKQINKETAAAASSFKGPEENGNDTAANNYNAKRVLVREQHIDSLSDIEQHTERTTGPANGISPKYATLPMKAPRTPNTPPPKPPMLSRTRSIGIGDSHSMSSPPPIATIPEFPISPTAYETNNNATTPTAAQDA